AARREGGGRPNGAPRAGREYRNAHGQAHPRAGPPGRRRPRLHPRLPPPAGRAEKPDRPRCPRRDRAVCAPERHVSDLEPRAHSLPATGKPSSAEQRVHRPPPAERLAPRKRYSGRRSGAMPSSAASLHALDNKPARTRPITHTAASENNPLMTSNRRACKKVFSNSTMTPTKNAISASMVPNGRTPNTVITTTRPAHFPHVTAAPSVRKEPSLMSST